jgi:hypothetical protein
MTNPSPSHSPSFLDQLQLQAKKQAKLHETRLLPRQLDSITSFVGNYPWQVLLALSGITALVIELL